MYSPLLELCPYALNHHHHQAPGELVTAPLPRNPEPQNQRDSNTVDRASEQSADNVNELPRKKSDCAPSRTAYVERFRIEEMILPPGSKKGPE